MDLNILFWILGMLFSLGIFALKVGFGLGYSGIRWKGIFIVLFMYIALFILIAVLSDHLILLLEPILRKGPFLHALMAVGMIVWGLYIVRRSSIATKSEIKIQAEGLSLKEKSQIENKKSKNSLPLTRHSLLLMVPCPVCLTAMTFSTWAALNVIKLPAYLVGLLLGIVFFSLSLLFFGITRLKSSIYPRINIGFSMIAIGIYFMASLVLPAKIEEAKGMYQSFVTQKSNIPMNNSIAVFVLLFVTLIVGYIVNKNREVKK